MTKACNLCRELFELSEEEQAMRIRLSALFEAGSMPKPVLCASCRTLVKTVWRNERNLYSRKCDQTGKDIISVYPHTAHFPVYERHEWWSDRWDPLSYGRPFDFSKPFFTQYKDLQAVAPRAALNTQNVENCDYCNFAFDSKNCYLCVCSYNSESNLYCYWMLRTSDCVDCSYCFESKQCLWCTDCNHIFNCVSCTLSHNCTDCFSLYDCRGCSNCFGCVGLRHKEYHMFNEKLSKSTYEQRIREFDLQNPMHVRAVEEKLAKLKMNHPRLYSIQEKTEQCTGDYIFESKNCTNAYQVYRSQDCINITDSETTDDLDSYHDGWSQATYNCYSVVNQQNSAFCIQCWDGHDNFYSDNCQSSSHTFGCIGLRRQEYCILNKKYTQEEYKLILPKIVAHMESTGEWGHFFPMELSPFAYNETMAMEYAPLTKTKANDRGLRWQDHLPYTQGKETVAWDAIPTHIEDVPDTITEEILACEKTGKNYRITKQELAFYKRKKLPLPRIHPDQRYQKRNALRNPRKLWKRICGKCGKEMQTTYSPERPACPPVAQRRRREIVYCEECYLKEVY